MITCLRYSLSFDVYDRRVFESRNLHNNLVDELLYYVENSEGLLSQKYSDGSLASTWFYLMPWANGSITDGLAVNYWDRS